MVPTQLNHTADASLHHSIFFIREYKRRIECYFNRSEMQRAAAANVRSNNDSM